MHLKNYLQHIIKKKIGISTSAEVIVACSGNKGNQMLQCLHLFKLSRKFVYKGEAGILSNIKKQNLFVMLYN